MSEAGVRDRATHEVDGGECGDGNACESCRACEHCSTCDSCDARESCDARDSCDARESCSNCNSTHCRSRRISCESGFNRIYKFRLFVFVGKSRISRGFPICQNSE